MYNAGDLVEIKSFEELDKEFGSDERTGLIKIEKDGSVFLPEMQYLSGTQFKVGYITCPIENELAIIDTYIITKSMVKPVELKLEDSVIQATELS